MTQKATINLKDHNMTGLSLCVGGKSLGKKMWNRNSGKSESNLPKKQVLTKWEERTVEDAFNDAKTFGRDLAASLENRIESCASDVGQENLFDIEETFQLLYGERLCNDHVKIQEGDLEMFGATTFQQFFFEVCNLTWENHMKISFGLGE